VSYPLRTVSGMARADIYCRISEDREGARKGVKRQEPDCRAFAARKGIEVAQVFVDNDLTAFRRKKLRPAYQQVYERVKDGVTTTVIVDHLDRLYRNTRELEDLIDLVEATQVRILTVSGGDFDLNTSDGRAVARIVVALAQKESEDKSRRIRRKHLELAEAGAVVGGGRPFGYENDRKTLRPAEADLIREAADRVLAGSSLRAVVADWQRRGIEKPGNQSTLRRILLNPRIAGLRAVGYRSKHHPGELLNQAAWAPVLDEDTWRRVKAVIEDPDRDGPFGTGARRYLLSGFVFCSLCGRRLSSSATRNKRPQLTRYYRCGSGPETGGCGRIRIVAEPLEELVARAAWERLASSELARRADRQDAAGEEWGLVTEDEVLTARLEELTVLWTAGDRTSEEWAVGRKALVARQEDVRRRLSQVRRSRVVDAAAGLEGSVKAAWPLLDLHRRRAILAAVIDRVVVGRAVTPGRVFDGRRVNVVWRSAEALDVPSEDL
jgi:site-specific DNA recombinase